MNSSIRFRPSVVAVVLLVALVGSACSSTKESGDGTASTAAPTGAPERADVVAALVDEVLTPLTSDAASRAANLGAATESLCAAPGDATLATARTELASAWSGWKLTDTFDMGPAMDRRSGSLLGYEVNPDKVDSAVAGGEEMTVDSVRNRMASNLRGFGAVDHLLRAPVASFSDPARCGYLQALVGVIVDETAQVAKGWTTGLDGAPPFATTSKGGGPDAMSPTDMIDLLVNMQLSFLESTSKRLSAVSESGSAVPIELAAGTLFVLAAQLRGLRAVYFAPDGSDVGLGQIVSNDLATKVADDVDALSKLLAEDADVPSEEQPTAEEAGDLAAAVEVVRRTVVTEVVSELDVTVSFSENDGDS